MSSLKLVQSALPKLKKILCVVVYVMRSQVMERTIVKRSEPNAYSLRQSIFIAMLELASGRFHKNELLVGSQVWTLLRSSTTSRQPLPGSIHTEHGLRETGF